MAPFSPNGFANGHRGNGNGRGPNSASSINLALDNMIRTQLKVSDPRNPKEIAQALMNYYKDLPQAVGITEEAQGLPFLQAPMPQAMLPPPRPTSSDAEFGMAENDVEKALGDLTTNPLTNDVVPEMQGWAQSIRDAVQEASAAARLGLDPSQRDKVIALRRQLGEYARMARFVGTLAPGMTQNYRRLAQGLDEVAAVILVMLGESLASVGFSSGYYLLQIPFAELRQRRDAVIFALRNFSGGAQESYGPDEWPRGISAYRNLYNWLEQQGQGDLRTLLVENEIARIMDNLIARAQNGTAEGLRALGVTAQLDIERFRRLAIVAPGAMPSLGGPGPAGGLHMRDLSPPMMAFLEAVLLFADAFRPAGGLRLLRIARPPILFYGLYNPNLVTQDTQLLELIMVRGALATSLDTLFPGDQDDDIIPQVLLDMLIASLDRGIDLLSLGVNSGNPANGRSTTETRAASYWLICVAIQAILDDGYVFAAASNPPKTWPKPPSLLHTWPDNPHRDSIKPAFDALLVDFDASFQAQAAKLGGVLRQQAGVAIGEPVGDPTSKVPLVAIFGRLRQTLSDALDAVNWNAHLTHVAIQEELRVQRSLESRWRDLVPTVAPEAGNQPRVFTWLQVVVSLAIELSTFHVPHGEEPMALRALPPQFEDTLVQIARRINP